MRFLVESQGNNSHLAAILFTNKTEEYGDSIVNSFVEYLESEYITASNDCIYDQHTDDSFWLSLSVDRDECTQAELKKHWATFKKIIKK